MTGDEQKKVGAERHFPFPIANFQLEKAESDPIEARSGERGAGTEDVKELSS